MKKSIFSLKAGAGVLKVRHHAKGLFNLIIFSGFLTFWGATSLFSQKIGFVSTDIIREKFTDAQQSDQRVTSIVEEWKRELASLERSIETLESDINKNRLIWTDEERSQKDKELTTLKTQKIDYARKKFESGGEYDQTVKTIMKPVEEKIFAAIQKVAANENFDLIWDKSRDPLAYVNYKFDLTVKVLKELGVDVKKLEDELQEKISKDPRNKKTDSKTSPRSRSRDRSKESREVERDGDSQVEPEKDNPEGSAAPSVMPVPGKEQKKNPIEPPKK